MKEYQIWSEGYLCSGMEGIPATAQLHATIEAESFKDACDKYFNNLSDEYSRICYDSERLMFWGCRLFDNEIDARKSFG